MKPAWRPLMLSLYVAVRQETDAARNDGIVRKRCFSLVSLAPFR
jgi:hypothetical protein